MEFIIIRLFEGHGIDRIVINWSENAEIVLETKRYEDCFLEYRFESDCKFTVSLYDKSNACTVLESREIEIHSFT